MALEITDSNFKEIVLETDKPVLVDFEQQVKSVSYGDCS